MLVIDISTNKKITETDSRFDVNDIVKLTYDFDDEQNVFYFRVVGISEDQGEYYVIEVWYVYFHWKRQICYFGNVTALLVCHFINEVPKEIAKFNDSCDNANIEFQSFLQYSMNA